MNITIEGQAYTLQEISEMSEQDVKQLLAFCDKPAMMLRIAKAHSPEMECYVDNILWS